ncbi:MAG TPA: transposase [Synergistaceae bacterium]|nr:transposase [Synergistaceae bacterium]
MIRKKELPEQQEFWVARQKIRAGKTKGFYDKLSRDLDKEGFGGFVRELCAPYYSENSVGRPPIDPEVYFKMLFVGFYENIGSERGIASRCEDSISVRAFLCYDITEAAPDHSSLSVIRERLPLEVYHEVFAFSLRPLRRAGLLKGENLGMDSSITEANASLEKLTSREDGKTYREYVGELAAEAEGIDPEDTEAVARFDRKRKGRKTSNQDWYSPNDPDAKIGPRKDGAWDMIHKIENVVDLDSGAILSVEVQDATKADAEGMAEHFETAAQMVDYTDGQLEKADEEGEPENQSEEDEQQATIRAAADKGYHKNEELARLTEAGIEPVVSCPHGRKSPVKNQRHKQAYETNEANRKSETGKEQLGQRAEKVERSFRHLLDYGRVRRATLTGHNRIAKRTLISAFAFNLSIYSWHVNGYGTAKQYAAGNRNLEALLGLFGLKKLLKTGYEAVKKLRIVLWMKNRLSKAKIGLSGKCRRIGNPTQFRLRNRVFSTVS